MWSWFTFYLIVHLLGVLMAFGPIFAFPILGSLLAKHPQHAVYAIEVIDTIEKRLTIPLAVIVPLAGTGLIFTAHIDLWHSEWLIIAIVMYIAAFFFAVTVQAPTGSRLLHMLQSMPAGPPPAAGGPPPVAGAGGPPPEVAAMTRKLRLGGMYLTFSVVVIMILMIWQPGGAFR
jgi:hypothetical protein